MQLLLALEAHLGEKVPLMNVPPSGRLLIPDDVAEAENVIFFGTQVVPGVSGRSVFWPLSVAPLDNHAMHLAFTGYKNRARQGLLRRRLARAVGRADALMFGSHYARSLYMARFRAAATLPYAVIPNGAPSLQGLRFVEVRDDPCPFRVLVTSHLDAYKGLLELVEGLALASTIFEGAAAVRIAGADREPAYARELRRALASRSLDRIVSVDVADAGELRGLYHEADLFIFTSVCENAGSFSLFDAFHAGLPIICSDRSSMPEMVGDAARLVNPYDPPGLAAAIDEMLGSAELRQDYAQLAREWAASAATWSDRAAAVLGAIDRWDL